MLQEREYSLPHCYQYQIRLQNSEIDLQTTNLLNEETKRLKVSDFEFSFVPKSDVFRCQEIKSFIERHEWLGTMPNRPTHRFIATYKGILAGVVVMSTPNAFSKILGKENRNLEKLISRGACISWSPKNLASALIMYSIRWMVKNTSYRIFTAYSDVEARELGTIYQACNFIYLGKNAGARAKYFDQENPSKGWFTDRVFRQVSHYKIYAEKLGIHWKNSFSSRKGMNWMNVPQDVERLLRSASVEHQKRCLKRPIDKKHKYLYILGRTKSETRTLKQLFIELNVKNSNLSYPKKRGV